MGGAGHAVLDRGAGVTIHMTEEQARKAGLLTSKKKTRTTRKAAGRAGAKSRCSCGEVFTSDARETAHVGIGHAKFETIIE